MRNVIRNDICQLTADSHGAEIVSLTKDGKEYIWSGDSKYWGRHAPVLFPFVGSLKGKEYTFDGKTYPMGQHGFARDMEFALKDSGDDFLQYELTENEDTLKKYPFRFKLGIRYELQDAGVKVIWTVKNPDTKTLWFSIGGHPAFMCPIDGRGTWADYRINIKNKGKNLEKTDTHPIDVEAGGLISDATRSYALKDGCIVPTDELFAGDALVIEDRQADEVSLIGPDGKAYVTVLFDTPLFGLWSPAGKGAPFICIEPWYGRADGVNFQGTLEERKYEMSLAPDETFTGGFEVRI